MTDVARTERGWCGHFICAYRCDFRRNTLLEFGDVRIVVSTVGAMRDGDTYDEIGHERHYETMAFHAKWEAPYWDADVKRQISFEGPWSQFGIERWSDLAVNAMHESIVAQISRRLAEGDRFEPDPCEQQESES